MWIDLFVDADRPRTIADQLYAQIQHAVEHGRLAAGDRLPTSRSLADDLGISRTTVTTVYARLVSEGWLVSRVGDGTFVAPRPDVRAHDPGPLGVVRARRPIPHPPRPRASEHLEVDLRTGRPDPRLFPMREWRRAVRRAMELPPPAYGDTAGHPPLRSALAAFVSRSRGLTAHEDQIVVTSGAQQAFDLCARALIAPGDVVAVEDPGYEAARRAFVGHGARLFPVPVDDHGIVVDLIPPTARVVFVTPSHQSPTGVTMAGHRRRDLLERAYRDDLVVIEDDYDTEYRYVDRPLEPIHRLDPEGRVIYIGTFSKTLSPSLRLGFLVAPRSLVTDLVAARSLSDAQPPHLTQAALANLISAGDLDRHLRRAGAVYRERHRLVVDRIAHLHRQGLSPTVWESNAGLHHFVELLPDVDDDRVAARLAEDGVLLGTTFFAWTRQRRPALSIGFGLADASGLDRAFDQLEAVLRS